MFRSRRGGLSYDRAIRLHNAAGPRDGSRCRMYARLPFHFRAAITPVDVAVAMADGIHASSAPSA